MRIVWSPVAEARVREAAAIERRERPLAAHRWLARLLQETTRLAHRSRDGVVVPELNHPRLAQFRYGDHRLIYRVEGHTIVILTLLPAASPPRRRVRFGRRCEPR